MKPQENKQDVFEIEDMRSLYEHALNDSEDVTELENSRDEKNIYEGEKTTTYVQLLQKRVLEKEEKIESSFGEDEIALLQMKARENEVKIESSFVEDDIPLLDKFPDPYPGVELSRKKNRIVHSLDNL